MGFSASLPYTIILILFFSYGHKKAWNLLCRCSTSEGLRIAWFIRTATEVHAVCIYTHIYG